ncbi:hypothetical protein HN51_028087, partial [Arachis hypogaea]
KCSGTMKYIKDNFMGDFGSLHEVVNDYSRMRLVVDLVYKWHNPKWDMIKELTVADWNKKMQQSVLQT